MFPILITDYFLWFLYKSDSRISCFRKDGEMKVSKVHRTCYSINWGSLELRMYSSIITSLKIQWKLSGLPKILESLMKFWMSPQKIWCLQWISWGLQWKFWGSTTKIWGLDAKLGVSNENLESATKIWCPMISLGSPTKIWGSPKKICGSQR